MSFCYCVPAFIVLYFQRVKRVVTNLLNRIRQINCESMVLLKISISLLAGHFLLQTSFVSVYDLIWNVLPSLLQAKLMAEISLISSPSLTVFPQGFLADGTSEQSVL